MAQASTGGGRRIKKKPEKSGRRMNGLNTKKLSKTGKTSVEQNQPNQLSTLHTVLMRST